MNNLAHELDEAEISQAMGTLVRIEGKVYVAQTSHGEVRAHRAVSCLVEPELHDFVLVALAPSSMRSGPSRQLVGYVLAVLERESPDTSLACDGNLEVKVREGRFRVASRDGIDLVSPKEVQLVADQVGIHASSAKLVAKEIVAIGTSVVAELVNVKLKGTFFDKVFERVSERVNRSFRRVDEIDQLKAKQIDHLAEETLSLRSANAVVTATDLVKVDGEQIHFG
jgi:hypothetical protein